MLVFALVESQQNRMFVITRTWIYLIRTGPGQAERPLASARTTAVGTERRMCISHNRNAFSLWLSLTVWGVKTVSRFSGR
ncbi:hypothetical protein M5M_06662 [Simiduia agarivorans SA1 = DSM 21679]|uniref:Uncharacterized protein n=1 Tax=Simiduia agarivorans (strain DSM 21679 / JCM 13881 / BCRC 17597 / SA1) TaxID=1117647 RepID=R9S609_SIMAS|nr:hypothetical protein M5M_06662 [Simiduia agarivorans SA1 = DSM 21679]